MDPKEKLYLNRPSKPCRLELRAPSLQDIKTELESDFRSFTPSWLENRYIMDKTQEPLTTLERTEGWVYQFNELLNHRLKNGSKLFIDLLLQYTSENSSSNLLLRFFRGALPQLAPFFPILAGVYGVVVMLVLNFPALRHEFLPKLTQAYHLFSSIWKEQGPEAAINHLHKTLVSLKNQIVERFEKRIKEIHTLGDLEEALGEFVAAALITLETGAGITKVTTSAVKTTSQFSIKAGKAALQVTKGAAASAPEWLASLEEATQRLTKNLSNAEIQEFLKRVQDKSKLNASKNAAQAKQVSATQPELAGANQKNPSMIEDVSRTAEGALREGVVVSGGRLFGRAATHEELKVYADVLNKYKVEPPVWTEKIAFKLDLQKHMSEVAGFTQKAGIKGAHNLESFSQKVLNDNIQIVSKVEHSSIKGLYGIEYKIPAYDGRGLQIGFKAPMTKTVYDPKVISDTEMLTLGQIAANSGYKSAVEAGVRQYNAVAGGINFRVYLEESTNIVTNVHPKL